MADAPKQFDIFAFMKNPKNAETVFQCAASLIFIFWFAFWFIAIMHKPENTGIIGDTFGSINALFSGLALLGVLYAIGLQHREVEMTDEQLKIAKEDRDKAREDAQKSEDARQESVRLLIKQKDALESTARLEAASSIARITETLATWKLNGVIQQPAARSALEELQEMRQFQRIVLWDIENPDFDWQGLDTEHRNKYRKYLSLFLRIQNHSCWPLYSDPPIQYKEREESIVLAVQEEIDTLIRQPGVIGSRNELVARKADLLLRDARQQGGRLDFVVLSEVCDRYLETREPSTKKEIQNSLLARKQELTSILRSMIECVLAV